jgi:threonine synthase
MDGSMRCAACGLRYGWDDPRWRCNCGGLLDPCDSQPFDPRRVEPVDASLWRYAAWLPDVPPITLGEGWTPLLPAELAGHRVWFKCDHQMPTGSFKDRGATVQVSRLAALGVNDLVEDSSGNAGSALAIYAAKAGLRASIFVPVDAPPAKLRMIREVGAELVAIPGSRSKVAAAVEQAAESRFYASHVWDPAYLLGTRTAAYEIAEQLGWQAPAAVVCPVGNGSLLLGLDQGFEHLHRSGVIQRVPRLIGVQAAACAPLAAAFRDSLAGPAAVVAQPTAAGGVAVANPARGAQILAAARASGGRIVSVGESELEAAWTRLATQGWYLEPTAAVAAAAAETTLRQRSFDSDVVVMLTGHGLKSA